MLTYNVTVIHPRQILAGLFELDPESFYLHLPEDEGNPLTDWADIPDMVIMNGGHEPIPRPEVTIHMPAGSTFRMDYVATENHQQFLERISSIINLPTRAFRTTFQGGASWLFPYDLEYEDDIHISVINVVRGGMRSTTAASSRSRSVSPTMPFRQPNIGGELQRRIMPEPEYHMEEVVIHVNESPIRNSADATAVNEGGSAGQIASARTAISRINLLSHLNNQIKESISHQTMQTWGQHAQGRGCTPARWRRSTRWRRP